MYEYARKIRRRGMYGLGVDDVTPGQQLALDYRSGAKTRAEIQNICIGVTPVGRYHTDYDECRWFLTPEDLCRREQGRSCTEEELRQQCFFTPTNLRNDRCFFYMDEMSSEDIAASNAGPEVDTSALQRAAGAVAEYRERVADAAESVVRTLRPVDPQVQALQRTILSSGCTLPRYGADGRWGTETAAGLQCLAGQQGWSSLLQQYPWVAQRVTVPSQAVATAKPAATAPVTITQSTPTPGATTTSVQQASIFPSLTIPGVPSWALWAFGGLGLLSIIALGAYLTRGR